MRFSVNMDGDVDQPEKDPAGLSWTDASILAGAVLGILMGLSMFSFEIAAVVGVLVLLYVVFKLLATKP